MVHKSLTDAEVILTESEYLVIKLSEHNNSLVIGGYIFNHNLER